MLIMISPRACPSASAPNIIENSRYIPTGSAMVNTMKATFVSVMAVVWAA